LKASSSGKNSSLEGKVVSVRAVRDALGRPAFIDVQAARHARDGEAVMLTIDNSLQFSAEEELRESMRKTGARAGSVIAMNATTGEILANGQHPELQPQRSRGAVDRRRNRAVTMVTNAGSTIKPILMASALPWLETD